MALARKVSTEGSIGSADNNHREDFVAFNKGFSQATGSNKKLNLLLNNPGLAVDEIYKDVYQMHQGEQKKLTGLEKTTPFSRHQILDFYSKFKALCHLSAAAGHDFKDKSGYKHL